MFEDTFRTFRPPQITPLALLLTTGLATSPALAQRALVVTSEQPAFADAARAALLALGPDAVRVSADETDRVALARAEVIITVGPRAERLVADAMPTTARVVGCFSARSSPLPVDRATIVPFRPGLDEQLALVTQMVPSTRAIAIFPEQGRRPGDVLASAKAAGMGALVPRDGEAFEDAVQRLVRGADLILVEDGAAIPPGGAMLIVKRATQAGKHVVGPNRAAVIGGALFAVVPDTQAQGYAAGDVAARLLRGETVTAAAAPPGRVLLNATIARSFGVKAPEHVARRSEEVE